MSIAEPQMSSLQIVSEQFRAEILAYIQSKVGDPTAADDLTQETFVKVSRALAKGTTPEHFRGWLYKIARNTTIDFLKERRRFVPFEELHAASESAAPKILDPSDDEFRKRLFAYALRVIESLPTEDCEVLSLTELDGLSREELAKELGISLTAAKSRVHRAREKLRKTVEECCTLVTDRYGRIIDWQKRGSPCCSSKNSAT